MKRLRKPARGAGWSCGAQTRTATWVVGSPGRLELWQGEPGHVGGSFPKGRAGAGAEVGRNWAGGADTSHRAGQLLGVGLAQCPLEEAHSQLGSMPCFPTTSRCWPWGISALRGLVGAHPGGPVGCRLSQEPLTRTAVLKLQFTLVLGTLWETLRQGLTTALEGRLAPIDALFPDMETGYGTAKEQLEGHRS